MRTGSGIEQIGNLKNSSQNSITIDCCATAFHGDVMLREKRGSHLPQICVSPLRDEPRLSDVRSLACDDP